MKDEKTVRYSRLNTRMEQYINSVNSEADPEDLHSQLRNLIAEAIKVDVTLAKLLEVLATSHIQGGKSEKFIGNVSRHYSRGQNTADKKSAEEADRLEVLKKKKDGIS